MHSSRRCTCLLLVIATLSALLGGTGSTQAATSKQVDAALEKARAYLFTLQNKNGTWDDTIIPPKPAESAANARSPNGGQWTGETALAVYALLAAGESPQNPKL